MQGVMNALRVAVGRAPGADRVGELLDLAGRDDPVYLFDAYAMTDLRLCSAFRAGSTDSRGTRVMSSNCLRHLSATVRILEPTLCIVQGVEVARQLATLLTTAQETTPNLYQGLLAGTPTLLATFPGLLGVDQMPAPERDRVSPRWSRDPPCRWHLAQVPDHLGRPPRRQPRPRHDLIPSAGSSTCGFVTAPP
jgi:hypothetical protein